MPTFAATRRGYLNLWNKAKLLDTRRGAADKAGQYILDHLDRYEAVAKRIGKPGLGPLIGALHWREASGSFAGVLHNGEKIIGTGRKTRLGPPNRGPFATWEDAAVDALKIKGWDKIDEWPIERWLYQTEPFNGWGYFLYRHENSPYLWAGTTLQQRGKYTSDGKFDASAWDQQLGVVAILIAIFNKRPDLAPGKASAVTPAVVTTGAGSAVVVASAVSGHEMFFAGALAATLFLGLVWVFSNRSKVMDGTKSLLASKGVWGGILAVAAGAVPVVASSLGYTVSGDDVNTLVSLGSGIISAIGGVVAIYGRVKATKKLV